MLPVGIQKLYLVRLDDDLDITVDIVDIVQQLIMHFIMGFFDQIVISFTIAESWFLAFGCEYARGRGLCDDHLP